MKKRIPFFTLLLCFLIGIALGYFWRNYLAGILLGLGVGMVVMVLLRFILPKNDGNPDQPAEK